MHVPDPPLWARVVLMVALVPVLAPPLGDWIGRRAPTPPMRPWNWAVLVAFAVLAVGNVARWRDPRTADLPDAEAVLTWVMMALLATSYGLTLLRRLGRSGGAEPGA
jgi:hypothetical protein